MNRATFAGIERKTHPNYNNYLPGVYDNREIEDPHDEDIIKEIIDIYNQYSKHIVVAGGEWNWIQENKQKEYKKVLSEGDKESLIQMYRNFFRNQISFGISAPDSESDLARKELVNDTLLDVDTWKEFCEDASIEKLNSPWIGNPFGITVEGSLVLYNSCRHYYHATKLKALTEHKKRPVIFEIGGGYGGVFYYLNQITDSFCYIVCDLMETLFTNYYYTQKWSYASHKNIKIKWALDGRINLNEIASYDLILVPSNSHNHIDVGFDIAYNANSFSEMSYQDVKDYFTTIDRNEPEYIFHQNSNYNLWETSSRGHTEVLAKDFPIPQGYQLVYQAISPWTGAGGRYREYLYQLK